MMIQLYVRNGCPFCHKVIKAAEKIGYQEGKDMTIIDAAPGTKGREVVLDIGGKAMVPFLLDGDTSLYESDDIIEYLRNSFNTLQ
jgi:glutathione S-transferase